MKPQNFIQNLKLKILLAGAILLAACSTPTTTYRSFIGERTGTGTGGTMVTVDGVEIWDRGAPPRKYKVIGYVEDTREESSGAAQARLEAVAAELKANGGDAAIEVSAIRERSGSTGGGVGTGVKIPVGPVTVRPGVDVNRYRADFREKVEYAVIVYMEEE